MGWLFATPMQIPNLFNTYPGTYLAQSFLHALLASIICGIAIGAWRIDNPRVRQRFRLGAILFAIFSFPAYELFDPGRRSLNFRLNALFNSSQWLDMELWGVIPFHLFLLAVFAATGVVYVLQEMLPILRHFSRPSPELELECNAPVDGSPLAATLEPLRSRLPEVFVIRDNDLVIFTVTGKSPAIYLSDGLAAVLTPDELRAALAHEIAHIERSKKPVLVAGFILRTLMFFNPVVLVEFRRVIRNEEKICDDAAVRDTGNAAALASALRKIYEPDNAEEDGGNRKTIDLQEQSHNVQLAARIKRLEQADAPAAEGGWFPFLVAWSVIILLNYFIV